MALCFLFDFVKEKTQGLNIVKRLITMYTTFTPSGQRSCLISKADHVKIFSFLFAISRKFF